MVRRHLRKAICLKSEIACLVSLIVNQRDECKKAPPFDWRGFFAFKLTKPDQVLVYQAEPGLNTSN
jgi:hypothetical protein